MHNISLKTAGVRAAAATSFMNNEYAPVHVFDVDIKYTRGARRWNVIWNTYILFLHLYMHVGGLGTRVRLGSPFLQQQQPSGFSA